VNKSWQILEYVKELGYIKSCDYLCEKKMEERYYVSDIVKEVARSILDAKMSFYHRINRRDITTAKDWSTKSVIRGLVPFKACKFNELTEDDLGLLMIICKSKGLNVKTHLLSIEETDELVVLLGVNLYSAEDGRIFRTEMMREIVKSVIIAKLSR
jgi:hypothetical protein